MTPRWKLVDGQLRVYVHVSNIQSSPVPLMPTSTVETYFCCTLNCVFQDKFIYDQQASFTELNHERALLAEQRAEFTIQSRLKDEERQKVMTKAQKVNGHKDMHTPRQYISG